jgi:serine/threonine protein kinase
VYLARRADPSNSEMLVAVKVIHDHLLEEGDFVRMFIDEANIAARMSHPNVVRVHEFSREGDSLYLAMEYLHGQPLSALFERCQVNGERLPFDLVAWIGARVAAGLHHAHLLTDDQGNRLELIHRDISPQNVFLTYDGKVKLIDFGIARAAGRLAKTTLGRIKGKFSYMAPEQVLGRDFDQRADLFALGATLFEVTVGERLFAGDDQTDTLQKLLFDEIPNPSDRVPGLPEPLARVIRKALAPEVGDRYADAAAIETDLNAFISQQGQQDQQARLASVM